MDKLSQFRQKLSDMDIEGKEELLSNFDDAFEENNNIKKQVIDQRDILKNEKKSLSENLDLVKSTLGLDEINGDNLKNVLSNTKIEESKLRDEISAKFEEKYSNDMKTLGIQLEELKTQNVDITNKYNDTLFVNAVVNSGLLENFVDDKDARDNIIIPRIKDKLLYKDGQVFVKDETTGDIATKLGTNEPLSPASVVDTLKSSISPIYLKAQSQASGMGMSHTQQAPQGGGKPDTSKYTDVGSVMKDGFASINKQ